MQDAGENRGKVRREGGGEREQEKREGTQREERKCVIGGGKTK